MGETADLSKGELTELAKMAALVEQLKINLDMVQEARRIQGSFPTEIRRRLEQRSEQIDLTQMITLLSGMSPSTLESWEVDNRLLLRFAEALTGNAVEDRYVFNDESIECIGSFVRMLLKLKPKSRQQMVRFMANIKHGEASYILIEGSPSGTEVRFRYRVPASLMEWFLKSGEADQN